MKGKQKKSESSIRNVHGRSIWLMSNKNTRKLKFQTKTRQTHLSKTEEKSNSSAKSESIIDRRLKFMHAGTTETVFIRSRSATLQIHCLARRMIISGGVVEPTAWKFPLHFSFYLVGDFTPSLFSEFHLFLFVYC